MEEDHSDNIAGAYFIIFNIIEPSILTQIDGFVSNANQIGFSIADICYHIPKDLGYYIQFDTSINFISPLYRSGKLTPTRSLTKWKSPNLSEGIYYWRARIFDGTDFGKWSQIRSFSIMNQSKKGYYAQEEILKTFSYRSLAILEAHYIINKCFLPEDYIIKNIKKIKHIKTSIVQGRYDFICPPIQAI